MGFCEEDSTVVAVSRSRLYKKGDTKLFLCILPSDTNKVTSSLTVLIGYSQSSRLGGFIVKS